MLKSWISQPRFKRRLGALMCAVGFGPFISFFNRHVSEKLCGV